MSYITHNLHALAQRDSRLALVLTTSRPAHSDVFSIVPAKNGSPTALVTVPAGEAHALHSLYDPCEEARALVKEVPYDASTIIIVGWFGLGYHVAAIASHLAPQQPLVVLEPVPALFRRALEECPYETLLADERIIWLVEADMAILRERLMTTLDRLVPYHAMSLRIHYVDFYQRWDRYRKTTATLRTACIQTLANSNEEHNRIMTYLDELRTNLGKKFLGNFKDCLAFFKNEAAAGRPLSERDIGLLITYFLFSYHSYAEAFVTGSHRGQHQTNPHH